MIIDEGTFEFGTDRQVEVAKEVNRQGSQARAAKSLGIDRSTVRDAIKGLEKRAAARGYSPKTLERGIIAPGLTIARESVNYDAAGNVKQRWLIAKPQAPAFEAMLDAFKTNCVPHLDGKARPGVRRAKKANASLLGLLAVGDPHFGMYAWGQETGQQDFNLKIAEQQWYDTIDRAVDKLPYTKQGVFLQLGDLTHGNDHKNITPGHGHHLDVDSRHQLVMRAAARCMFYAAERMREKCDRLLVESLGGNHSPETVMALNLAIEAYFRREKDVTVSMSARDIRLIVEFGAVMLTTSHGDKAKPERIQPLVSAGYAEEWGRTATYARERGAHRTAKRYHHGGHVHHIDKRDFEGLQFEAHRSPAPMDAHAAARYYSEQSVTSIVYHELEGEVERATTNVIPA